MSGAVYGDKCEFMRFTRSRAAVNCSFNINSIPLTKVSSHKHLGVTLSSDLSWKSRVPSVAEKADHILGLLKRTFGRCSEAIKMGYISMVRPMIEYACPVCVSESDNLFVHHMVSGQVDVFSLTNVRFEHTSLEKTNFLFKVYGQMKG